MFSMIELNVVDEIASLEKFVEGSLAELWAMFDLFDAEGVVDSPELNNRVKAALASDKPVHGLAHHFTGQIKGGWYWDGKNW